MTAEQLNSPMYSAFRRLAKAFTGARMTFFAHHNIISNRIHSLEKRHHELTAAYQLTSDQLTKEIDTLKREYNRRAGTAQAKNLPQKTNRLQ